MAHVFGNRTHTYSGGNKGFLGINGRRTIMGGTSIAVTGKAGEVVYISMQSATSSKIDQGICGQAVAGEVDCSITLQDPTVACNPNEIMQKGISWCNTRTFVPGTIQSFAETPVFTAMKLEFKANASFYLYAR